MELWLLWRHQLKGHYGRKESGLFSAALRPPPHTCTNLCTNTHCGMLFLARAAALRAASSSSAASAVRPLGKHGRHSAHSSAARVTECAFEPNNALFMPQHIFPPACEAAAEGTAFLANTGETLPEGRDATLPAITRVTGVGTPSGAEGVDH